MSAAAIEFRNVTKIYKRVFSDERMEALTDVSFEVAAGEVCAFLGPNGAGKTTSISILMGFLLPQFGQRARARLPTRRHARQGADRLPAGEFRLLQVPHRAQTAALASGARRPARTRTGER